MHSFSSPASNPFNSKPRITSAVDVKVCKQAQQTHTHTHHICIHIMCLYLYIYIYISQKQQSKQGASPLVQSEHRNNPTQPKGECSMPSKKQEKLADLAGALKEDWAVDNIKACLLGNHQVVDQAWSQHRTPLLKPTRIGRGMHYTMKQEGPTTAPVLCWAFGWEGVDVLWLRSVGQ